MISLRDYQQDIISGCRQAFREGHKSVLIQLPTGGGKTLTSAFMVGNAAARGRTCWWLVHRREIIAQASQTFHSLGIDHGQILGGAITDRAQRVQIGSVQTVARKLDHLPEPAMIFFDEAHHMASGQYQAIFDRFPDALKVGMTATPWRLDGMGLSCWFSKMVDGPSVSMLIDRGALSAYRLFAPSVPDVSHIGVSAGDFKRGELASLMSKPAIFGNAIQHYSQLCPGKRAVAFGCSIEHSRNIAAEFRASGIVAEHVDGQMDHGERDAAVRRFVAGETLVLCNADLFGEGFDVPAIEASILLRPTQSLSLYLQQVGRALRPAPGKDRAIILDHAGNSLRHGLPDDEREWSLEDRVKRARAAKESDSPVRQCLKCFRVYRPAPRCPGCGAAAPVQIREVEQREGELVEVAKAAAQRARWTEERDCRTFDDWQRLAAARGYKPGWARVRWEQRQRRAA